MWLETQPLNKGHRFVVLLPSVKPVVWSFIWVSANVSLQKRSGSWSRNEWHWLERWFFNSKSIQHRFPWRINRWIVWRWNDSKHCFLSRKHEKHEMARISKAAGRKRNTMKTTGNGTRIRLQRRNWKAKRDDEISVSPSSSHSENSENGQLVFIGRRRARFQNGCSWTETVARAARAIRRPGRTPRFSHLIQDRRAVRSYGTNQKFLKKFIVFRPRHRVSTLAF